MKPAKRGTKAGSCLQGTFLLIGGYSLKKSSKRRAKHNKIM